MSVTRPDPNRTHVIRHVRTWRPDQKRAKALPPQQPSRGTDGYAFRMPAKLGTLGGMLV